MINKRIRLTAVIIALSLIVPIVTVKVLALTDPGSYVPPVNSEGLYPTPDDPNFPEPGHFMRETIGFTVDEINDTVKYFRSDEWMNGMRALRRDLQAVLDQNPGNPAAQAAAFPGLYDRAQALVTEHIQRLQEKLTYNLEKPWLNDNICENIDNPCAKDANGKTLDDKIKDDLTTFFNAQINQIKNVFAPKITAAKTVTDLKNVIDQIQAYTDQQILRDQAKSLGGRVFSQRLLNFSNFIQGLVLYIDCAAPKFGAAGYDISYYTKYMAAMDSRFKTDWYQTTEIIDPKRPWETFNFVLFDAARSTVKYTSHGGKWEYQKASDTVANPACKGNTSCKEETTKHMRAAKYNLQDMFHIFYGFYDRIQKQIDSGKRPTSQINLSTCTFPVLDGFQCGPTSSGSYSCDNSKPFAFPSSSTNRGGGLLPSRGISRTPSARPTY